MPALRCRSHITIAITMAFCFPSEKKEKKKSDSRYSHWACMEIPLLAASRQKMWVDRAGQKLLEVCQ